jgi:hypothetical protein
VLVGVRQGDRPSPTLFGLFIEVLEQYIKRAVGPACTWQGKVPAVLHTAVCMLMYADDVVLLGSDPATLQLQLDALAQFGTDWDMRCQPGQNQGGGVQLGRGWGPGSQPCPSHLGLPGAASGTGPAIQVPGAHL